MKHRFSTADWSDGHAVEVWRSWLANELHPVDVTSYDPGSFYAESEITTFGEIEIVRFYGSPQALVRQQAAIRSFHSDDFLLSVGRTAPSTFEHNGYNTKCCGGDIILFDTGRPYVVAHESNIETVGIVVPRKHLESRLAATGVAAGLTLTCRNTSTKLIYGYLRQLVRHSEALDPVSARRLSLIAVDLIAAGFDERLSRDQPRRNRQAAIIVQAQAFIEDNLSNPDLGLQNVADALKISSRHLYLVFATEQRSAMDHLWERRLLRARELLIGDIARAMPISAIAYRVGFKNPAHFARRFKGRFGISATELRNQLRRE